MPKSTIVAHQYTISNGTTWTSDIVYLASSHRGNVALRARSLDTTTFCQLQGYESNYPSTFLKQQADPYSAEFWHTSPLNTTMFPGYVGYYTDAMSDLPVTAIYFTVQALADYYLSIILSWT